MKRKPDLSTSSEVLNHVYFETNPYNNSEEYLIYTQAKNNLGRGTRQDNKQIATKNKIITKSDLESF